MQDLFSRVSDDLLCLMLSKLKMKEAVRCSVLSKRWRFLYTKIPQLIISPSGIMDCNNYECEKVHLLSLLPARVEDIISNILQRHSSDLEAFELLREIKMWASNINGVPWWQFSRRSVWKWLEIVAQKNVLHLTLCHSGETDVPPPALFSCTSLTTLTLTNYSLCCFPSHFTGFNHLITCTFGEMVFKDDEPLTSFTSHCPQLQKFSLRCCNGLRKPVICAPNLKHLHVYDDFVQVLIVNCPKLQTLKADMICLNDLRVNGLLFYELSNRIDKIKLEGGNNLVALSIYENEEIVNLPEQRFVEIMGSFRSLKELNISSWQQMLEREKQMADPLINLLVRLPNLERLHIPGLFLQELAIDLIPPCLTSPLANLRTVKVDMRDYQEWEIPVSEFPEEISVLGCLVHSTPALESMEIRIMEDENEVLETFSGFVRKLSEVSRASGQAKICLKIL